MIENYLEKDILNQIKLLTLCYDYYPSITLDKSCHQLGLSELLIRKYCHDLTTLFNSQLSLNIEKSTIVYQSNGVTREQAFKYIYHQSHVLQLLKFLITNDSGRLPLTYFSEKFGLSCATAYRIRKHISPLLEKLGFKIFKNTITGDEYRIRYLIAHLNARFGIEVYPLSKMDKLLIKRLLLEYSTTFTASHYFPNTFIFFDTLQYCVKNVIIDSFKINLKKDDIDYIFLAYLTSHNSFSNPNWTEKRIDNVIAIFENYPKFQKLLQPLKDALPLSDSYHDELVKVAIIFSRTFILGLNQLIPETISFPSWNYHRHDKLTTILRPIITNWLSEIGEYTFKEQHFLLLCAHLERIIKNHIPPIQIAVLTTDFINNKILTECLSQRFSSKQIHFHPYYLLTDDLSNITNLNPDIIITNPKLSSFIKHEISSESLITYIDLIHTPDQINQIQEIISSIQEEKYCKLFAKNNEITTRSSYNS
ncbi:TPA: helix-turn-helix domain-containing protein [Streptococcus agalactiae]|nr:helix-turn-helix domain-containing protein [Streptococcus agalactiae]